MVHLPLGWLRLADGTRDNSRHEPCLDDELRLCRHQGIFDAQGIGVPIEHPEKLGDRPPPLIAVPELFCGTAGERHVRRSVSSVEGPAISRITRVRRGLAKPMRCGAPGRGGTEVLTGAVLADLPGVKTQSRRASEWGMHASMPYQASRSSPGYVERRAGV